MCYNETDGLLWTCVLSSCYLVPPELLQHIFIHQSVSVITALGDADLLQ